MNRLTFLALLLTFAIGTPAKAIVNGYEPTDARFDAVAALSFAYWLGQDPGHVNAKEHNWFCNATLVTETMVLTAAHCVSEWPPLPTGWTLRQQQYAARFRRKPDGSLGSIAAGPDSYHHVYVDTWIAANVGDFAIGFLREPVVHIAPIPAILKGTQTLRPGSPFKHAGWGKQGPGPNEGPRTQLLLSDNWFSDHRFGPSYSRYAFIWHDAWFPAGPYPLSSGAGVNMHDSGSPVLLEDPNNGELRQAGIVTTYTGGGNLTQFFEHPTFVIPHTPFTGLDLELHTTGTAPISYAPGAIIEFSGAVVALGSSSPADPFMLRAWISLDKVFGDGNDLEVASFEMSLPEPEVSVSFSGLRIPDDTPEGVYYLGVFVDADDTVAEALEGNNSWTSKDPDVIVSPIPISYRGIYVGRLNVGGSYDGGFALYYRDDNTAALFAYSNSQQRGYRSTEFAVSDAGDFSFIDNGAPVAGKISGAGIEGSIEDQIFFQGDEEPLPGSFGHITGLYVGTFDSRPQSEFLMIVGPNGTPFLLAKDIDFERGNVGLLWPNGSGEYGLAALLGDIHIQATIGYDAVVANYTVTGTATGNGILGGSFTLVREVSSSRYVSPSADVCAEDCTDLDLQADNDGGELVDQSESPFDPGESGEWATEIPASTTSADPEAATDLGTTNIEAHAAGGCNGGRAEPICVLLPLLLLVSARVRRSRRRPRDGRGGPVDRIATKSDPGSRCRGGPCAGEPL